MNINDRLKCEEKAISLLEDKIKLLSNEIMIIDNYLDKYGDYKTFKKFKIKTFTNKFNKLLNEQSEMKKELKHRRLYRLNLKDKINEINLKDIIIIN